MIKKKLENLKMEQHSCDYSEHSFLLGIVENNRYQLNI